MTPTKNILITLLMIFSSNTFAGKVITLNPGETLPLANGDVVACFGQQESPQPPAPPPP